MATEAFRVSTWRSYYDQVRVLGQYLKDSRPDIDGNPPRFCISLDERKKVQSEIDELLKYCDKYLDKCKIHPRESKWIYNRDNETTWASSPKFKYGNLMRKHKYMTVTF